MLFVIVSARTPASDNISGVVAPEVQVQDTL